MFYSIPSSSDEVITVTPHGAKSIRYLFFENKNDKIFHYGGKLDTVSISVDGKQIAQEIPICPFCTTTPYGAGRFDWQRCALEVNLNVDNSEIKISGTVNNEYNIVFVCSEEQVDESGGFDFVEFKEFTLKSTPNESEAIAIVYDMLKSNFAAIQSVVSSDVPLDTPAATLYEGATYTDGRLTSVAISLTKAEAEGLRINQIGVDNYDTWKTDVAVDDIVQHLITVLAHKIINSVAPTFNANVMECENVIALDHEPEKMVAFNYTTPITTDSVVPMQICDINLAALLKTGDNQEIPQGFDLGIVSITNRIPYADAVYVFQQKTVKHIKATFEICGNEDLLAAGKGTSIANWKLAMIFIYKKLA
ncbi:MAG: hypothetical protein IKO46_05940 [Salinivirgaceae bacterium]|nr:hypothetical protein [Salinivirgaceae bacterium]